VGWDDEARARATLVDMQRRLARGPEDAFGLDRAATPESVRAAFLALTKQFHPARFGRLPTELQRLSNEVFLGIKSAHETLLRSLGVPARPRGSSLHRTDQSGAMPVVTAEGSSKVTMKIPTGQHPHVRAVGTQQPVNNPTIPRTLTPHRTARTTTPGRGVPAVPRTMTPAQTSSPAIPRTLTPHRVPSPTVRRTPPPAARPTPPHGAPSTHRPGIPPNVSFRAPTPQTPESPARDAGAVPPTFDDRKEEARARALLSARNWVAARQVLHGLVAHDQTSKHYRALLHYARGLEAQANGKGEDAAMELLRALELDPTLTEAGAAYKDLLRRR
jgi:hypothetical protein